MTPPAYAGGIIFSSKQAYLLLDFTILLNIAGYISHTSYFSFYKKTKIFIYVIQILCYMVLKLI